MKWTRELRIKLAVAVGVLLLSTLTACTVSAAGGIIGGAGALTFAVFLLFTGTSQSGCGPVIGPCLSPVHPCLSEPYDPGDAGPIENNVPPPDAGVPLTPCLSIARPPPDAAARLTPCLSIAPQRDAGVPAPDAYMGPCLSPQPDVGPCLSPLEPDVGPCLSEPFDGFAPLNPSSTAPHVPLIDDRKSSIEKLESKLPADVVQRLLDGQDE